MGTSENPDGLIYKIGQHLWRIIPRRAVKIFCLGQIYGGFCQTNLYWTDKKGNRNDFGFDNYPEEVSLEIADLAIQLAHSEFHVADPFTHFAVEVSGSAQILAKFGYIKEEDSWVGLYMKGVSDLSEPEALELGIPIEHWQARKAAGAL